MLAALRSRSSRSRGCAGARGQDGDHDHDGHHRHDRRRPSPIRCRPRRSRRRAPHSTAAQVEQLFLADPKVADWLSRYPPNPTVSATLLRRHLDGQRLLGQGGRDRDGHRRRRLGRRDRGVDGPAGGVDDGARLPGRVRRREAQQLRGLARLLRHLPARPDRLAAPAVAAERSTCSCWSRSRSRSGSSTTATSSRRCRRRTRRWPGCSCAASGSARRDRPPRGAAVWPVWLLIAATVFLAGFRVGLNVRDVRRDRRRLLGRDRRRPDLARPEPVRALPGRGQPPEVRAGRLVGRGPRPHPDERPLREREPARRHLRPGRLPGVSARLLDLRLERQVGLAAVGALHRRCSSTPRAARARAGRAPARRASTRRRRSRSPGRRGRSPSTRPTRTRTT